MKREQDENLLPLYASKRLIYLYIVVRLKSHTRANSLTFRLPF